MHGASTETETVCTVTATGESGSHSQEFRLYTVSDRTPAALHLGALTVVQARTDEIDIQVDVPGSLPGDPMLDVGNFLAHLKWSCRVSRKGAGFGEYHDAFREEALQRFRWAESDLRLREAVCLFRICTNAVRHPREDWRQRLATGLSLVNEVLD